MTIIPLNIDPYTPWTYYILTGVAHMISSWAKIEKTFFSFCGVALTLYFFWCWECRACLLPPNPSSVGTESLGGLEGVWAGGWVTDRYLSRQLPFFFPALYLSPVERETAGLFTQPWSGGKGEQLRGKTAGYNVRSPNGSDEGWETDRWHGFLDGGWRLKSFPHWTPAWLKVRGPSNFPGLSGLTSCVGGFWLMLNFEELTQYMHWHR